MVRSQAAIIRDYWSDHPLPPTGETHPKGSEKGSKKGTPKWSSLGPLKSSVLDPIFDLFGKVIRDANTSKSAKKPNGNVALLARFAFHDFTDFWRTGKNGPDRLPGGPQNH